jgi:uncharacterized membrane protein YvbJ
MFCNKCGKQIADSSTFCEYCGASIVNSNLGAQAAQPQPVYQPQPNFQPQRQAHQPQQLINRLKIVAIILISLGVIEFIFGCMCAGFDWGYIAYGASAISIATGIGFWHVYNLLAAHLIK